MSIHITDTRSHELVMIEERESLVGTRNDCLRQLTEGCKNAPSVGKVAQSNFAKDEWMQEDLSLVQSAGKVLSCSPEMINPNRRVDQHHSRGGRRRGIG